MDIPELKDMIEEEESTDRGDWYKVHSNREIFGAAMTAVIERLDGIHDTLKRIEKNQKD